MREIGLEQVLDPRGRVLGFHVAQDLAADRALGAEAAAGNDVIAIDRIAFLIDRDARRDETDVADVMLRAGMMAAREMDVDRLIEGDARLAPLAMSSAWALVSAAENRHPREPVQATSPARIDDARQSSPALSTAALASPRCASGIPEIKRFCQTVRRRSPSPKSRAMRGERAHLGAVHLADRQNDAEIEETLLLLRMHADMRLPVLRRARREYAFHRRA